MFPFKVNMISILLKLSELSHEWLLKNFKYQEPVFYSRLFENDEEGPFEVPLGITNVGVTRKPVPDDPKLYV